MSDATPCVVSRAIFIRNPRHAEFNELQLSKLLVEFEALRKTGSPLEVEAIAEIVELIELASAKPHRYLVFIGD